VCSFFFCAWYPFWQTAQEGALYSGLVSEEVDETSGKQRVTWQVFSLNLQSCEKESTPSINSKVVFKVLDLVRTKLKKVSRLKTLMFRSRFEGEACRRRELAGCLLCEMTSSWLGFVQPAGCFPLCRELKTAENLQIWKTCRLWQERTKIPVMTY